MYVELLTLMDTVFIENLAFAERTYACVSVSQEGGPASADPAAPDIGEDPKWQSAFISEMSKELGVPSQRLQLLWQ